MKNIFIMIFLIASYSLFTEELLNLKGNPVQGGLLMGTVSDSIESVFYDYEEISIVENRFVLGFDRDEKLHHIITIVHADGKMLSNRFTIKERKYDIQKIDRIKKKYVEQPKDNKLLKRISSESKMLKEAREKIYKNDSFYFSQCIRPIIGGRISGVFGSQRILNGISKRPHNGLDIAVPKGTSTRAMVDGEVALTGDYYYNGKFVLLDHGKGLSSIYIHLSKYSVKQGDFVFAGDKIGEVGSTGRSTGNHLHWGINFGKKRIDPELITEMEESFIVIKK